MNTENQETRMRMAMMQHLEDAADLCRQLSARDRPFYLAFALLAWERTGGPLTEEEIDMMVDTAIAGMHAAVARHFGIAIVGLPFSL